MPTKIDFPMRQNPPIVFADISRYQASNPLVQPVVHFDFDKYVAKGAPMIMLRAQVDNAGIDYEFWHNVGECRRLALPYGIYHYVKLWKSIPNQLAAMGDLTNAVKDDPLYISTRLDIEANDGLNKTVFTGNAEKLFSGMYGKTGEIPWLYTGPYFWDYNTYPASWMKDVRWWVAHHFHALDYSKVPTVRPLLPNCIADIQNPFICTEWQFDTHDGGFAWGSNGDNEIDLNFFTWNGGTATEFQKLYGFAITPPAPPPDPEPEPEPDSAPLYRVEVIASALNVRRFPGGTAPGDPDDGTLLKGTVIPIYEEETVPGDPNPWGLMAGHISLSPSLVRKTTKK